MNKMQGGKVLGKVTHKIMNRNAETEDNSHTQLVCELSLVSEILLNGSKFSTLLCQK